MKRLLSLLLSAVMVLMLASCANNVAQEEPTGAGNSSAPEISAPADPTPSEPVTIKIGVPTAPPALPILHMIEEQLLGENVTIELDIWNAPEQLIAMVQDGGHDMFAFPLNVLAKLSNNGMPVRLLNVNTWGVTYFLTTDPDFQSWSDLSGKTVYVPLQSSPP